MTIYLWVTGVCWAFAVVGNIIKLYERNEQPTPLIYRAWNVAINTALLAWAAVLVSR
jgi:hypothetical protein